MAPNAQHGDKNRWPTCAHSGYLTPAPGLTPRNITSAFWWSPCWGEITMSA